MKNHFYNSHGFAIHYLLEIREFRDEQSQVVKQVFQGDAPQVLRQKAIEKVGDFSNLLVLENTSLVRRFLDSVFNFEYLASINI